ncbi:copper resistance CopC family protein [Pseudonocardia dioxanivorans]|uniref:Copper resistance protein CopC n=1 Tax=Pseudonocardia dioxanivorans (strain ATCC 55486 / DSM 44775 / JCM 13855 / CB1190) TaxID=675635 RepID=F4CXF4_PSEUX|nr:copper resistance CopC family protein [Pseudonocardia dioxanivorans]AEA26528.1 copper resistance protein CopC [Pseudonocardia dioxanivorans CB1190]
MTSTHRHAWLRRTSAVLVLAAATVFGTATPALAHDELRSATPAQGATLTTAPDTARLQFSAALDPQFVSTAVTTPDGRRWEAGATRVEGSTVVVPLQTAVPAGTYTVAYRVTSQDGHPITGGLTYQVTTSSEVTTTPSAAAAPTTAQAAPLTPAAESQDRGMPVWPWLLGAVLLLLAAAGVIIRRVAR